MDIKRHQTSDRMSRAVVHNNTVYLCGHVADDFSNGIKEQTSTMLSRIEKTLNEVGSSSERMLSVTLYIANGDDFHTVNEVWEQWVPTGTAPARACIVSAFPNSNILIEATVTAAL